MSRFLSLLILLFLFPVYSFGQDKNGALEFKKIQIGLTISPDICFRELKNNNGSTISDVIIKFRNENEVIKIGYTGGITICYNLKRFIGVEVGLLYSNKGFQTKFSDIQITTPNPSLPEKIKYIYSFEYFDVPLKFNLTLGKRKIRPFISTSVTTNILIKEIETSVLKFSDRTETEQQLTNFVKNKINISPTISIGIDYKINRLMNIKVEPIFRYGLQKLTNSEIASYLYNGGLNIGFYVGL